MTPPCRECGRATVYVSGGLCTTCRRKLDPAVAERGRAGSLRWKATNRAAKRAADNAYEADPERRGRCLHCGGLMGIGMHRDGVCQRCREALCHEQRLWICEQWRAGKPLGEIAAMLDRSKGSLAGDIFRMRQLGYDIPYRRQAHARRSS